MGIIIGGGLVVVEVHYGFGRHKYYLTSWQFIEYQKYAYGEWIQTFQTLMLTKVSICLFLLRIPIENHFIRPLQATIVALVLSNVILTILFIVQCRPVDAAWNTNIQGKCFTKGQLQRIIISQAIISIISDFLLAAFPILILRKVQISLRTKVGLCMLMSLGLITAACCLVRTIMNWQNVNSDPSWESIDNWYWRSWEVCVGITAASIPALRPGYKRLSSTISSYREMRTSRKSSKTLVNDQHHERAPVISNLKDTNRVDLAYAIPHIQHPDSVASSKHRPVISGLGADSGWTKGDVTGGYIMEQWRGGNIQKTTTVDIESQADSRRHGSRERNEDFEGEERLREIF